MADDSDGQAIKLWSVESQTVVRIFQGHTNIVTSFAFSFDGKYLVSGSLDKTVKLWSIEALNEILSLQGHSSGVACVAFSPDGN
jgi:WD40 repeat protein